MEKIGLYCAVFGLASIVLSFMDMNIKLLVWIDLWGDTIGWTIRIALVVIGVSLFFLGKRASKEEA